MQTFLIFVLSYTVYIKREDITLIIYEHTPVQVVFSSEMLDPTTLRNMMFQPK